MCGIAGVLDPKIAQKEAVIGDMVAKMVHRGPDDDGFFVDKYVGLGMRRLSIIDLSTGKQPITSANGKLLIFFNGEIYNYKELREELLAQGFKFKTDSDTEVILHMYENEGEKMLTKLRGMFVFCIYNTETKEIFIARDFFGIKPLYYLMQAGNPGSKAELTTGHRIIAFSSEIKSFVGFPDFKLEVNDNAVYNYLSFQYNPLSETFFKTVYKLPPAHFLKINVETGETEIKKYWSFKFDQHEIFQSSPKSPRQDLGEKEIEMSKTVFDTVKDSVEHHMIADVPVGAFLSGGVDSSIITSLMQEIRGENLSSRAAEPEQSTVHGKQYATGLRKIKTFTIGFDTLTEGNEAKQTSDFLGTDHTEIKIGPDEYFKELPKAVYHFDEPVADPSAIGLYFVAREASKHVKVVLSGEGADELFGGYNIYLAPIASARLAWIPKSLIQLFLNLPFGFFGKNYLGRVKMKLEEWYIGNACVFNQKEIDNLWKPARLAWQGDADGDRRNKEKHKLVSLAPLYKQVSGLSPSTQMQYIDINTWLVGDILAKADKMTMTHSLELRVPFLDIEVAKLAKTLPDKFKWNNGVTKYLLREAFKKIIPESTRNRKKLGFPIPIRDWLMTDRDDVYKTIFENEYIKTHMDLEYVKKIIEDHVSKKSDNSRKIYTLLMLAMWYNTFIKMK